jgi:hypothetical protein
MVSRLRPLDGGGTEVAVDTDVNISGILAQMGRGIIESGSTQIFQQFTASMRQKLETSGSDQEGVQSAQSEVKPLDGLSVGAKAVGQTVGRAVRRLLGRNHEGR